MNNSTTSRFFLAIPALLAACAGTPTDPTEDTTPLAAVQSDTRSDAYVVMFKRGTANVDAVVDGMIKGQGITVRQRYYTAIQGFAGAIPAAALEGIRRNPAVDLVEVDGVARPVVKQTLTSLQWGLDRLDTRPLTYDLGYNYLVDGTGVDVYILDTGIKLTHPEFGNRARFFANYTTFGRDDVFGHGTHVAGIVGGATTGVAKNVNLWAVKVLGDDGTGSYSNIIAGVDAVTKVKTSTPTKRVIGNLSLGGGFSGALNNAINNSVAAGVVWAVAAGNSGDDACKYSPASATAALTVGASTSGDSRASFSNYGSCLDLFAPGDAIYSSTNTLGYASWSGTSMASPHVAGAAALYLSANPSASAGTVQAWLVNNATAGSLGGIGSGSPNRLLFVGGLDSLATYTLSVSRTGTGTGTVTGVGINCGTDCSENLLAGSAVTLTATPAAGSSFTGWSGACTNATATCTVSMDAAKTVTASFTGAAAVELRVSDIDGAAKLSKSSWTATGTFEVRTSGGALASGAVVTVQMSGPATGTLTCTTGSTGRCTVTTPKFATTATSVSLSVSRVARNSDTYTGAANSDPDGDSNGTTITITR